MTSRGPLREDPEMPTQWKSESVTDLLLDWITTFGCKS